MKAIYKTKRPLLRYPGSKNQLAEWIISHLPDDHDTYNEPFVGSAAIATAKERSPMETINDLSGDLVNMLIVFRDNKDELIKKIEQTYWSRSEWQLSFEAADEPVERARRFYVRCWMSIRPFDPRPSFRRQKKLSRGKTGKSSPMTPAARLFMDTDHLHHIANRLRGVAIENMDALEFIKMYDYDRALFYVDPPYPFSTRQRKNPVYPHDEMADSDHEKLFNVLDGINGMAVVSGYACDLYADLYEAAGWKRVDQKARIDGGGEAIESLWLSPRTWQALKRPSQTSMFGAVFSANYAST